MHVRIPTPLRSYTGNASVVDGSGDTLDELLRDLDGRFPGMRFRIIDEQDRIREHILIFVNQVRAMDLSQPLAPGDDVRIVPAISGGSGVTGTSRAMWIV